MLKKKKYKIFHGHMIYFNWNDSEWIIIIIIKYSSRTWHPPVSSHSFTLGVMGRLMVLTLWNETELNVGLLFYCEGQPFNTKWSVEIPCELLLHLGQSQRQLTDGISHELCVQWGWCVDPPPQQTPGDLIKRGCALVVGGAVVPKRVHFCQMHQ